MREMDLVLGRFAQAHMLSMTEEELCHFEEILAFSDQKLYGFFFGNGVLAESHLTMMLERVRFTLSSSVLEALDFQRKS